jgi:hypothetical protein
MTTTLDLPEDLFTEAKRKASGRGESLQTFVIEAIRSRLEAAATLGNTPAIMDFAGIFKSSRTESLRIMEVIEEGCEQVRAGDWT